VTSPTIPYGSWPTPITSELVVRAARAPGAVAVDGAEIWWSESRPDEGGRTALCRRSADGAVEDVLGPDWNVRTAVHEYGGGAWWVRDGVVWFVDWASQRLHRLDVGMGDAVPLTPEPEVPRGLRWADGDVHPDGTVLAVVRETHPAGGGAALVRNEVVLLDAASPSDGEVAVTGPDFVADPRWSPDGAHLSWLEWDHPDMPWDATRLVVRDLATGTDRVVAGGPGESVCQPRWAPDGSLWHASDRSGFWSLHRWSPAGAETEVVADVGADIGAPQWVFGQSSYAHLDDGRTVLAYRRAGLDQLAVRRTDGTVVDLQVPHTSVDSLAAAGDRAVYVAASPTLEPHVVAVGVDGDDRATLPDVVAPPRDLGLDQAWFSVPEPLAFTTAGGATAHALLYRPTNPLAIAPAGEQPPLLVLIHGGPTSAARPMLKLATQYWTSRGFAVVDVNYRGSTGYGRAYRDLLRGQWGVADVEDCVAVARHLAAVGEADPARCCIRGGSAGGFTTLAALAFHDTFAAGASHYGVADLEVLARETHKFESRYLDGLVGPYPEARETYVERSPINHVDRIDRPLAVFQGLEDEIVPPSQSEMIVAALRARGVPVAYVTFEGEQHGFRQAPNIRRALDGELSFYAQVLGFELPEAEGIDPIDVAGLG
jgi:dipeptidyl aminopeptidase/acylaminoacyl peptidase